MSPSNMELRIGTIQDYNNKIIVATDAQGLGLNNNLNTKPVPPKQTQTVNGTKTKQSHPEQPDYHAIAEKYAKAHNLPQSWVDQVCDSDVKLAYQLEKNHKKDLTSSVSDTPSQHHEPPPPPKKKKQQKNKTTKKQNKTNSTNRWKHSCWYCCNNTLQSYLVIHSLAATYNKPVPAATRAHQLVPNQFTIFPVAERSHDTIDPITPGNAAAVFPARFASNIPRSCSCFLTHSLTPPPVMMVA